MLNWTFVLFTISNVHLNYCSHVKHMVLVTNKTIKQITSLWGFQICFSCEFYGDNIKRTNYFD
jgi:hypothetical protein